MSPTGEASLTELALLYYVSGQEARADVLAEQSRGRDIGRLDATTLTRICTRANAVGALTCTRAGAMPGLPTRDEVDRFLAERSR